MPLWDPMRCGETVGKSCQGSPGQIIDDLGLEADSVTIEMYSAKYHFLPEDAKFTVLAVFKAEGLRPKA